MNERNKELLKTDICERLNKGVKCSYKISTYENKKRIATVTGFTKLDGVETTHRKYRGCVGDLIKFEGNNNLFDLDFKLLLLPLPSLLEEISLKSFRNGEPFTPVDFFEVTDDHNTCYIEQDFGNIKLIKDLESIAKNDSNFDVQFLPNWVVGWFKEWHIDYNGLINKGLAIDVTKLKTNPYN